MKTCLLITDDPDDHDAFSEAVSEISKHIVVMAMSNCEQALNVLKSQKYQPDYIFLDLSMYGMRANSFLKAMINETDLAAIPVVVYGDKADIDKLRYPYHWPGLGKDYTFMELRTFLKDVIKPDGKAGG